MGQDFLDIQYVYSEKVDGIKRERERYIYESSSRLKNFDLLKFIMREREKRVYFPLFTNKEGYRGCTSVSQTI